MAPVLSQAATGGGAFLSSTHHCSLKIAHPIPPLFSKRRPKFSTSRRVKPLALANAADSSSGAAPNSKPISSRSSAVQFEEEGSDSIAFVGKENVSLEGVIQYEKPESSSLFAKWGLVAVLAGGDVAALLLFSAIGGYGEDGRGKNGLWRAVTTAAKSWSLGIPLGLIVRAITIGHTPPANFILVTMGSTAVLLIGWRALLFSIFLTDKGKNNDVYKRGSFFELFELLTSLVRRW